MLLMSSRGGGVGGYSGLQLGEFLNVDRGIGPGKDSRELEALDLERQEQARRTAQ